MWLNDESRLASQRPSQPTEITPGDMLVEAGEVGRFLMKGCPAPADDLYSGKLGLALFLAYLSKVVEFPDFLVVASDWILGLAGKGYSDTNSGGAYTGRGAFIWSLLHLWHITSSGKYLEMALSEAELLSKQVRYDQKFDVVSGSAGLIHVLLDLHCVSSSPRVLEILQQCGDHLVQHHIRTDNGAGWRTLSASPLPGFAHGGAGIASALLRMASIRDEPRYTAVAQDALRLDRYLRNHGDPGPHQSREVEASWCWGAGGQVVSFLVFPKPQFDSPEQQELESSLRRLTIGERASDCLCHGRFGDVDILLSASKRLHRPDLKEIALKKVKALVGCKQNNGQWHVPSQVSTVPSYSLMTGLAGIGFGLLRAADPDGVPSLLCFDGLKTLNT